MSGGLPEFLWFSSFCLSALLTILCFWQRKAKSHFFFNIWIAYSTVGSCVLYIASRIGTHVYSLTYVILDVVEVPLQILVVYGFACQALRYQGHWLSSFKQRVVSATLISAASAGVVGVYAEVAAAPSVDRILIRISLPGAVFVCGLMLQLLWLSYSSGFVGTRFQRRCFAGFMVWTFVGCLSDALHVNSSLLKYTERFDTFLTGAVVALFCYWIVVLLLPSSPKYNAELGRRDLGALVAEL